MVKYTSFRWNEGDYPITAYSKSSQAAVLMECLWLADFCQHDLGQPLR